MAVTYSAEQKLEILKYAEKYGEKCASEKYNCTERSIFRWKNIYNGSLESLENKYCAPYTPHPNSHTEEEIRNINKVLAENPYISHKELYKKLNNEYGYNRNIGGLYNYLRRHNLLPEPKLKNDYSTMFDSAAVKRINYKFLFSNKEHLPYYVIEINNIGIYIAKEEANNPCDLTVYYSTALKFNNKSEAVSFIQSIQNTSNYKLSIKEINQGEILWNKQQKFLYG